MCSALTMLLSQGQQMERVQDSKAHCNNAHELPAQY